MSGTALLRNQATGALAAAAVNATSTSPLLPPLVSGLTGMGGGMWIDGGSAALAQRYEIGGGGNILLLLLRGQPN